MRLWVAIALSIFDKNVQKVSKSSLLGKGRYVKVPSLKRRCCSLLPKRIKQIRKILQSECHLFRGRQTRGNRSAQTGRKVDIRTPVLPRESTDSYYWQHRDSPSLCTIKNRVGKSSESG